MEVPTASFQNEDMKQATVDITQGYYEVLVAWTDKWASNPNILQKFKDDISFDRDTSFCRMEVAKMGKVVEDKV